MLLGRENENRFNGFSAAGKPLKRLAYSMTVHTRLKPGVNKMGEETHIVSAPRHQRFSISAGNDSNSFTA